MQKITQHAGEVRHPTTVGCGGTNQQNPHAGLFLARKATVVLLYLIGYANGNPNTRQAFCQVCWAI
jgi:hypothetical protein